MAELGGVKRNTQSIYESGQRAPDAIYFARIAEQGASVAWIITGEGKPCSPLPHAKEQASLERLRHTAGEMTGDFDAPPSPPAPGRLTNTEAELLHGYRTLPDPDRAVIERVVTGLLAAQAA